MPEKIKLFFDHFYRVVSAEAFEDAKKLVSIFPQAEHRRTEGAGGWEGVYIYTSSGPYIEILRTDDYWKSDFVGVCVSQFGDEDDLHKKIVDANPAHSFKLHEVNRANGDPWLLCSVQTADESIYFFSIEYRGSERPKRKNMGRTTDNWLTSITSLECSATGAQFDKIPLLVDWFAHPSRLTKDELSLLIPQVVGGEFCMNVQTKKDFHSPFPFRISGAFDEKILTETKRIKNISLQHFRLDLKSGEYCLEYLG